MHNVSTLTPNVVQMAQVGQAQTASPLQVSPAIRKLFLVLHGAYGNLFVSKFSTGEKDAQGHDKGIRAAMKVWDAKLSKYPDEVIELAADRLMVKHKDFPPNMPQFEEVCDAAMPKKTYAQEQGLVALPAPVVAPLKVDLELKNDGKDWARSILARIKEGDQTVKKYAADSARITLGMNGKQAWQ